MDLNSLANNFLVILNNYRTQNGLGTLSHNSLLDASAEWMAHDMAQNGYFLHTDSLGRDPNKRIKDFGYTFSTTRGENILAATTDAQKAFNDWYSACDPDPNSNCTYAHRKNMLDPNFKAIGISIAYNPNSQYKYYWVTTFGGVDSINPPVTTSGVSANNIRANNNATNNNATNNILSNVETNNIPSNITANNVPSNIATNNVPSNIETNNIPSNIAANNITTSQQPFINNTLPSNRLPRTYQTTSSNRQGTTTLLTDGPGLYYTQRYVGQPTQIQNQLQQVKTVTQQPILRPTSGVFTGTATLSSEATNTNNQATTSNISSDVNFAETPNTALKQDNNIYFILLLVFIVILIIFARYSRR